MSQIISINISRKLTLFKDYWRPKVVGEFNDTEIKVVKLKGEFVWHHHEKEDELFWVIQGELIIHLHDKDIRVTEGEFVIIPRMVEQKPEAREEAHIVLIEPKGTLNTGNVEDKKTVKNLKKI